MKAAIVERPGVLTVREISEPQVGDYDALCAMLFGATCTGTDQHLLGGRFPWPVNYPTILGHESIGRVVRVGAKVRNLKVGDVVSRVGTPAPPESGIDINWGGFAQFGIAKDYRAMRDDGLPQPDWMPYRINQIVPPDIDPAAATMLITWRETFSYISRMGVGEGASVLVIGSGGVGLSFIAHARNLGATRIAVVGQEARRASAGETGATEFFDYRAPDLAEQLTAANPEGYDFIIDSLGKKGGVAEFLSCLRVGGLLTIYGLDDHGQWNLDLSKARGTFTYYVGGYDEEEVHEQVIAMMRDGRLRAEWWLDLEHPFALDEINAAYDAVRERRQIKALVKLTDE